MTDELNPSFTFDAFVVGANNRLAVAAARTVSESPGASYNPLFIYSQTGLGKTHLLMAIGHRARELSPDLQLTYLTLDDFVEAFHAAIAAGRGDGFHAEMAQRDLILLDDVQFLSHSREMQTELLRLAEACHERRAQLVLTSDRPPSEMEDLDDRLLQQLGGGLVVDIGVPEYETRLAILQRRAEDRGAKLSPDVLAAVAEFDVQHVRALLGILNRLHAFQSVSEKELTPQEARALVLGDTPQADPAAGQAPSGSGEDEFGAFLSGLTAAVSAQVEHWAGGVQRAIQEWSARGYHTGALEALLSDEFQGPTEVAVKAFEETVERLRALEAEMAEYDPDGARNPVFRTPERLQDAEDLLRHARTSFVPPLGPSDAFDLDEFILSDATKMVVEAARAVVEEPATRYNPLVIVGPTGCGKTHLIHSVGRRLRDHSGQLVACLSAEAFTNELVEAIDRNAVPAWRARYRQASAFLLDDIPAVAEKGQTQEELFNLFNLFVDAGRQLVFTSDQPPTEIAGLDDRLVSRLSGGLVATLAPPDTELLRTLAGSRLEARVGNADPELVQYLAERPATSVRGFLNVIHKVLSGAEAAGTPPNIDLARVLLEAAARPEPRRSLGVRTSGAVAVPVAGMRSMEKFVWTWPDPLDRLIEDLV